MRDEERPRPGRPARETNHPLGRRLREQRLAHGWTVRELALRLGLSESAAAYISQLEAGQKTPNERVAAALAEVLEDGSGVYPLWAQLGRRTDALTATRAIAHLAEILQDPRLAESLRGVGDATMISAPRSAQQMMEADEPATAKARWLKSDAEAAPPPPPPAARRQPAPKAAGLGSTLARLFRAKSPRSERPIESRAMARVDAGSAELHAAKLPPEYLDSRSVRRTTPSPEGAGVGAEWVALHLPRVPIVPPKHPGPQVRELRVLPDALEPERFLARADDEGPRTVWVDGAAFEGGDPGLWFVSRVTRDLNAAAFGLRPHEMLVMESARRPSRPRSFCLVRVSGRLRWELVAFNGRHSIVLDESGDSFRVLDGEDVHLVAVALARLDTPFSPRPASSDPAWRVAR